MGIVNKCSVQLEPFFTAAMDGQWDSASNIFDSISADENIADDLKKQFRLNMPKNLFMPVSRSDLLSILGYQDRIANLSKDICGIVLGRKMEIPKTLQTDFMGFIKSTIQASEQALKAINELDELLETGFVGQEVQFVKKLIKELDAKEQKVDKKERKLRHHLFQLEGDLPPIHVMFLYNIIDNIGEIADTAESVGNRLELLIAK